MIFCFYFWEKLRKFFRFLSNILAALPYLVLWLRKNMDPCQSKCRHPILRWSYPPVTVLFTAVFHVEWKCYYYPLTTLLCVAENVNNKKKNLALPNLPNRQFSVWQTGYKKRRYSWTESSKRRKKSIIVKDFFGILHLGSFCILSFYFLFLY